MSYNWSKILDSVDTPIHLLTAHMDVSHGYDHAIAVMKRARQIVGTRDFLCFRLDFQRYDTQSKQLSQAVVDRIIIGALMHDILDHKYKQPFSNDEIRGLFKFILTDEQLDFAFWIMVNNSWSKEMRGETKWHPTYYLEQAVIQDADRLEALGEVGIERCMEFNNNNVEDVRQHCIDKLIKIPKYMRYSATLDIIDDEKLMEPIQKMIDM